MVWPVWGVAAVLRGEEGQPNRWRLDMAATVATLEGAWAGGLRRRRGGFLWRVGQATVSLVLGRQALCCMRESSGMGGGAESAASGDVSQALGNSEHKWSGTSDKPSISWLVRLGACLLRQATLKLKTLCG